MRWARLMSVGLLGSCAGAPPAAGEQAASPVVAQPTPIIAEQSPSPNPEPSIAETSGESRAVSDAGSIIACKGSLAAAGADELRTRALDTQGCYEKALLEDPKLVGRMAVRIRIEATADVTNVGIERDAIGNSGLRSCVVAVFARRMTAPPVDGCVDVLIPIKFEPKYPADGGQNSRR